MNKNHSGDLMDELQADVDMLREKRVEYIHEFADSSSGRSAAPESGIKFTVNGKQVTIDQNRHRVLLQVLREDLGLTGTKYGCGEGQCGACTILLNGRAVRSCIFPVSRLAGSTVTTIEGLAENGKFHPVQEAFIKEGAMQCGYCTPGMILTTMELLQENPHPTDDEIIEKMNGNICRCNNYVNIIAAVRRSMENIR